ncbi:hypothetical protein IL306_005874 [Fusarium sp. DS 682]|nr:hypothetical protein IL306_005874 [Fusarium sp. DS 682]
MSHDTSAFRERLWKALRLFDTFASGSLGRPICTYETRNTKAEKGYSSAIDMAAIIKAVLREVYGPSKSYYWSIILLTRPVLLDRAATQAMRGGVSDNSYRDGQGASPPSHPDTALVYASVDSAVRIVRLLQSVLTREDLPKRLPFPVHSAFTAALTLGVATFADLDHVFPLRSNLEIVVQQLQSACDEYFEQRNNRIIEKQSHLVGELFGRLQEKVPLPRHKRERMDGAWADESVTARELQTPLASLSTICLTEASALEDYPTSVGGTFPDLSLDSFQESSLIDISHIEDTSDVGSLAFSSLSWFQ